MFKIRCHACRLVLCSVHNTTYCKHDVSGTTAGPRREFVVSPVEGSVTREEAEVPRVCIRHPNSCRAHTRMCCVNVKSTVCVFSLSTIDSTNKHADNIRH